MTRLFTLLCMGLAAPANAQEFTHVLTGGTNIIAYENAVEAVIVDMSGELVISADHTINGDGTLTYIYMQKCAWEAPDASLANNCRVIDVKDGTFTITGAVLETIERDDDDNPLKDAIFELADAKASAPQDNVPYKISLTLSPATLPAEVLEIWGLAGGNIVTRETGAGTLGLLASGAFDQPFELLVLNSETTLDVPGNAHRHSFAGTYNSGTLVHAWGQVMLSSIDRNWLPSATDPWVYLSTWADEEWADAPPEHPLTEEEIKSLDEYADVPDLSENRDKINDLITEFYHDLADAGAIGPVLNYDVLNIQRETKGLPPLVPKNGY